MINALRRRHPEFLYSISVTTRAKRRGERSGVQYYFASPGEFEQLSQKGQLVEWAEVHGQRYGTLRLNVERALRMRRVMLFDLDVQGAAAIRATLPEAVSVFLLPPSLPVLVRRLRGRRSEDRAALQTRLETAKRELERAGEYEYLVTNGELNDCVDDCEAVIRAELIRRRARMSTGTGTPDLG